MGRRPRERSETGIYHAILKGMDGRSLFYDGEDRDVFMDKLRRAREIGGMELYAYCLMDNHVHLLVKEGEELGISMKRLTVGYVQFHNKKYGRTGHLFLNRYHSEVVEDDRYLLAVTRYIHRNPVKAHLVSDPAEYPYSSYKNYLISFETGGEYSGVNTQIICDYFKTLKDFEQFTREETDDGCLEIVEIIKCTDEHLREILSRDGRYAVLLALPANERDELIAAAYSESGASIRQLSRVLGIAKHFVEKALKK